MNYRLIFNVVGRIIMLTAALMVLPLIISLIYGESTQVFAFLIAIVIAAVIGGALFLIFKKSEKIIYAKEGFLIVSLAWVVLSLLGAIPFVISKDIPNYINAFFETVSGFTTTGATILVDIESMSKGMLFWRSFTHWIGGMGILVMLAALFPSDSERTIHILKAEMPGPQFGKLRPKIKDTAKILYIMYIVLTAVEIIMLICGGMSVFDSAVHAFGTAGTGGFSTMNDSIGAFSPYSQWVIAVFMVLFGANFNLYFLMVVKKFKEALKSTELHVYLSIILLTTTIITINLLTSNAVAMTFGEALRTAFFQVSSFITTTGYVTIDTNTIPILAQSVLIILMFLGGCAGSTAGGLKVSRIIILFKTLKKNLKRVFNPRTIKAVTFEGRTLDSTTVHEVNSYFVLYAFILAGAFLAVSAFNPKMGIITNFTAVLSCLNNVGPYFGGAAHYADFHVVSKIVLSFIMLFGRLELYPMMLLFSPGGWRRN